MAATRLLLVLGHGRSDGLCHHLARSAREELERLGVELRVHDLLADGFDPVLRLAPGESHACAVTEADDPLTFRYQADVRWAEAYLFVHPVWWFAPPALLKGWVDRVLADGVALRHDTEPPTGLLGGRRALLMQTFKAPKLVDRLVMRRLSTRFWSGVVFPSIDVRGLPPLSLYEAGRLTPRRLERFERRLRRSIGRLVAAQPVDSAP